MKCQWRPIPRFERPGSAITGDHFSSSSSDDHGSRESAANTFLLNRITSRPGGQ